MGGKRRAAAGDEAHGIEIAERPYRAEQRANQIETGHHGNGDVPEEAEPAGAIDLGGLIELGRDGHDPGKENDGPERHPLPDMGVDYRAESESSVVQPWWTVG